MCYTLVMIVETLREYIIKSDKTRYRIAKDTGIDQATLCRVMQGESCSVETAELLCEYFGLKLTEQPKRKSRRT